MLLRVTGDKHSPCMKLPGVFVTTEAATFESSKLSNMLLKGCHLHAADLVALLSEHCGFLKVEWMDVYQHAVHDLVWYSRGIAQLDVQM